MTGSKFFQKDFIDNIVDPADPDYESDSTHQSDNEGWAVSIEDNHDSPDLPDLADVSASEAEDESDGEIRVGVKRKAKDDGGWVDSDNSDGEEVGVEEIMALEVIETAEQQWQKIFSKVSSHF